MTADRTVKALEVPKLVVMLANGKEVHHHLAATEMTIGRDPTNRICLTDQFVSKFHAKLVKAEADQAWVLTDLGSANKTYVNGEPITEATVRFGDAIRFASVECRLAPPEARDDDEEEAASAPAPAPVPAPPSIASPPVAPSPPPQPQATETPAPSPARPGMPPPPPRRAPAPKRAGSSAPKIEADPMQRLLRIGALLILISLVLGIFLRILLVPSETTTTEADARDAGAGTGTSESTAGAADTPSTPNANDAERDAGSSSTTRADAGASLDASGNRTAEFYFDEGLSYLDTGRLKDAQASFRRVIDLDPDHSRARTRLSLLDEEIESQAQTHFDRAREAFQFLRYEEAISEWEMFLQLADAGDVRYAEAQQGIEQAQSRLR